MPTAVKDGVLASSLVDNFSGEDFIVSPEALNTVQQGATFIVDLRDGISRLPINPGKVKNLLSTPLSTPISETTERPADIAPEPGEERAKQVAHLVSEGLTLENALEKTKPGSSQVGTKSSGVDINPVVVIQHNTPASSSSSGEPLSSSEKLKNSVAAQSAAISQEVSVRASYGGPSIRHDLLGWGKFKADQLVFSQIRRAFGRPETTSGNAAVSGTGSVPTTSRGIGVQTAAPIGRTIESGQRSSSPGSSQPTSVTSGASAGFSTAPGNDLSRDDGTSGSSPQGSLSREKISGSGGPALGSGEAVKSDSSGKSGILSAAGNKIGGAAGMVGKVKGAINTVQLAGRAAAGDVSAMIQLGAKGLKWAWNNKERLFKIGAGIAGGGLLYLYGLVAPWLSAFSPAALAGAGIGGAVGFLVGGPLGMAIGIPLGAFVGANWTAVVAGVGNALASISGAIAAVGSGLAGVVAAITSSAAAAIGVLSALTIGGAAVFVAVPEATKLEIWGQSEVEQVQLIVHKTATPDKIANDQSGSVVYKITLVNDSGLDIPIKINDRTVKVYGKAASKTIIMPNPTAPLPTMISKTNNSGNPLVITYLPLTGPATTYNDSQIVNTVVVEADDPQTKQKKSYSAEATVVIGSIEDDHPYGFPSSGWLSSVDAEPCTDHQGVFYGIAGVVKGGLDIVGAPNSVVVSTLDGTVTAAKWDESSYSVGGYVYITSKSGNFVAGFLHMNTPTVKVGDEVKRGQPIGTIYAKKLPTTGGPHVHYQVIQRVNGQWVNAAFSDSARSGACLADPSDSPEANISPRVLIAPTYTQAGCSAVPRVYVMKDSVQQDVTCAK